MKPLDFIIIGAQKSGTTSLFKYLSRHPRILLPPEKELPFFTQDRAFNEGWTAFARRYYGSGHTDRLWGKATPSYLHDPRVAERIAGRMPQARLVALLRHPIERAVSHYKMNVRRGREERTFGDAMEDLLDLHSAERARRLTSNVRHETTLYLAWGEYGRQLERYYQRFDDQRILVLFTDDLATDPLSTMRSTLSFLGLSPDFKPPNLGTVYHRGSTTRKLDWLDSTWSKRILARVPGRLGRRIRFWLEIWNIDARTDRIVNIPEALYKRLVAHFAPDIASLEALIGSTVPWGHLRSGGAP